MKNGPCPAPSVGLAVHTGTSSHGGTSSWPLVDVPPELSALVSTEVSLSVWLAVVLLVELSLLSPWLVVVEELKPELVEWLALLVALVVELAAALVFVEVVEVVVALCELDDAAEELLVVAVEVVEET
jgi:hypothetical protein